MWCLDRDNVTGRGLARVVIVRTLLCCLLQVDLVSMPEGPDNPHGNGFWAKETPLLTESKAMRVADPAAARAWKISNPTSTHPVTGIQCAGMRCTSVHVDHDSVL